jgi:hypothetical protein
VGSASGSDFRVAGDFVIGVPGFLTAEVLVAVRWCCSIIACFAAGCPL